MVSVAGLVAENNYFNFAMAFANLLFLREAVFFKMVCFFTALSRVDMAAFMASMASLFLPSVIKVRTVLTAALNLSLLAILNSCLLRDCLIALPADLVLGMF